MTTNTKKSINDNIAPLTLSNINNETVNIPAQDKLTHLQFRRFAGCPICNLHLQSFLSRADELKENNIEEIVVFHASQAKMLEYVIDTQTATNFHLIADPDRKLYDLFGLQGTWKSLLSTKVLSSIRQGMQLKPLTTPEKIASEWIVPADFLIDETGNIIALKYGTHANDQWSVDELLSLL